MTRKVDLYRLIANILYDSVYWFLIFSVIQCVLLKVDISFFAMVVILVMNLMTYIAAKHARNKIFLILSLAIVYGLNFLLPLDIGSKVTLYLIGVVFVIKIFNYINNNYVIKNVDEAPYVMVVTAVVSYMYGYLIKADTLKKESFVLLFVMLVLYFIKLYLQGLQGYIRSTKNVSGLPLEKIISTNNVFVFCIIAGFVTSMLLARLFGFDTIIVNCLNMLKRVFGLIIGMIILVVKLISKDDGVEIEEEEAEEQEQIKSLVLDDFTSDLARFMDALFRIILLLVVLYIIYKMVKKITVKLIKAKNNPDDIIEVSKDIKIDDLKKKGFIERIKENSNKEAKIRRYYKLKVLRYKHSIDIDNQSSCNDIAADLKEKELADVDELTEIYKDVRYGGKKADRELVNKVDKLVKNSSY